MTNKMVHRNDNKDYKTVHPSSTTTTTALSWEKLLCGDPNIMFCYPIMTFKKISG